MRAEHMGIEVVRSVWHIIHWVILDIWIVPFKLNIYRHIKWKKSF